MPECTVRERGSSYQSVSVLLQYIVEIVVGQSVRPDCDCLFASFAAHANEKIRLFFRRLATATIATTTSNYEAKLKVITGKCRHICTIYDIRYICIATLNNCCVFRFYRVATLLVVVVFISCTHFLQFTHFEQTLYSVSVYAKCLQKVLKTNNIYRLYGKTPMRKRFFPRESYKTWKMKRVSQRHKKRRCRWSYDGVNII